MEHGVIRDAWWAVMILLIAAVAHAEDSAPGVLAQFTSADGKTVDIRQDRLVALYVPTGSAPTPFVPAGAFKVTWRGFVTLRIRSEYQFSAEGRGAVRVIANDALALEVSGEDLSKGQPKAVKLLKGKNRLEVQ